MSEKPMRELRCRMLVDLAVRKFSEATRRNYIRHIAAFAKFLRCSLGTAIGADPGHGPRQGILVEVGHPALIDAGRAF